MKPDERACAELRPGDALVALRRTVWADSAAGTLLAIALGFLVVHMPAAPVGPLLLLALAGPVVALVVGDLRRVLLAVVLLDIPLHWDVNLAWRPDAVAVGAVGGISISATTLALVGLYALWIAERTAGRTHALRLWPALPLVAYVGVTALSLVVAEDRQLGVFELLLLLQTLLLFLYVANEVRNQEDVGFIVVGLLAAFLLESTVMIAQSALGISFQWIGLSSSTRELVGASASDLRAGGTIGGANAAAAFIAMLLPISIVVLWMDVAAWIKRFALVATAVGVVALVFTYSRGGWLAAIVAASSSRSLRSTAETYQVAGLRQLVRWFSFSSSHSTAASRPEFPARPKGPRTRKTPGFR